MSTRLSIAPMRRRLAGAPLDVLVRSGAGMAVRGVEVAGKFGLYVLAARRLGAGNAGLFFLCLTWLSLGATAARMGLERAVMRHVSAELAVGRGTAALAAIRLALGGTALGGVALGIATALVAHPAALHVFGMPDLAWPLALSGLALAPQALSITAGAVLIAMHRPIAAQWVQNALWPALTLLAVAGGIARLDVLVLAVTGANALAAGIGVALIWRERGCFADRTAPTSETAVVLPSLWRTARPLLLVELVQVTLNSLPVLVLSTVADAASVGAFSTANRISMLVWVVVISVSVIAAPAFAEHHRRGEIAALRRMNRLVRLAIILFGLPALAAMVAAPGLLLGTIGPAYRVASGALVILAAGQTVNCLLSCQDVMLAMTGHGGLLQRLNLLQLAGSLVLSATLIPAFGMTGAAIVAAVAMAQGAIGTTLTVRRVLPGVL